MPVTVEGKMVDGRTIILDHPLANGQSEVLVRLKKKTGRTRIPVTGTIRHDDRRNRY